MSLSLSEILTIAEKHKFVRIIPSTNIDSLLASGILLKILKENNIEASLTLNTRILAETRKHVPTILIDLPKPENNSDLDNVFTLQYSGDSSISAHIVSFFEQQKGIDSWSKILSLIAGIYRGLDIGKEGFQGLEREILEDLSRRDLISVDFGFRFWGWGRAKLVEMITRTLIPYIPGYTGERSKAEKLVKDLLGLDDPETATSTHIFLETEPERAKKFAQYLYETMLGDEELKKKVILRLIGHTYSVELYGYGIDVLEIYGSLEVFNSLEEKNPIYLALMSLYENTIFHILAIYKDLIDLLSVEISAIMQEILDNKTYIVDAHTLQRPELLVDILSSIGKLPKDKPIILKKDNTLYTSLSELLRTGTDPRILYSHCNEKQLCKVNEDGSIYTG